MTSRQASTIDTLCATRAFAAMLVVALIVPACGRHDAKSTDPMSTAEKNPEPPTRPSSQPASGVVEAPFVAVVPEDSTTKPTTGAESSASKGIGPGNGSTAVGGKTQ